MTTPTDTDTRASAAAPASAPPASSDGYLAATVGGLVGAFLLAAIGVAAGIALMEIYEDPNGGMANLGLLLYPLGLGALGVLVGMAAGVRVALGMIGATEATRTAWLTVPFSVGFLFMVVAGGVGILGLPAVPVLARSVVLRTPGDAVR